MPQNGRTRHSFLRNTADIAIGSIAGFLAVTIQPLVAPRQLWSTTTKITNGAQCLVAHARVYGLSELIFCIGKQLGLMAQQKRALSFLTGDARYENKSPDEIAIQFAHGAVRGKPDRSRLGSIRRAFKWQRRYRRLDAVIKRSRPAHPTKTSAAIPYLTKT